MSFPSFSVTPVSVVVITAIMLGALVARSSMKQSRLRDLRRQEAMRKLRESKEDLIKNLRFSSPTPEQALEIEGSILIEQTEAFFSDNDGEIVGLEIKQWRLNRDREYFYLIAGYDDRIFVKHSPQINAQVALGKKYQAPARHIPAPLHRPLFSEGVIGCMILSALMCFYAIMVVVVNVADPSVGLPCHTKPSNGRLLLERADAYFLPDTGPRIFLASGGGRSRSKLGERLKLLPNGTVLSADFCHAQMVRLRYENETLRETFQERLDGSRRSSYWSAAMVTLIAFAISASAFLISRQ